MRQSQLGSSGVAVSRIGLGGYELEDHDPARALAVLEAALEAGTNWVDTAEAYFDGGNETNLSAALAAHQEMQVASKIWPERTRPDATGVRTACEASLRRLGRSVIDVYFVHSPAEDVSLEETWSAMAALVDDGLVRAIGLSNYAIEEVEAAHRLRAVDVVQDGLSLIDNLQGREHFAACAEQGIAGVVYEPLASGLLTGRYQADSDLSALMRWPQMYGRLFARGRYERSLDVTTRLHELAREWGTSTSELAVAWCAHQHGVASVLVGTRSPGHAASNAAAGRIELTVEQLHALDALIPLGPAALGPVT